MEKLYSDIQKRIEAIRFDVLNSAEKAGRKAEDISLMAVTKTQPPQHVNIAIDCGINLLGENRAQELLEKHESYNKQKASIHFIGHLQTNKVKQIINLVDMIHSVDSVKLASEINSQAAANNKIMDILVEVNIGQEKSKNGIMPQLLENFVTEISQFKHIKVSGLMAIPPIYVDNGQNERFFFNMQQLLVDISAKKIDNVNMCTLSMGMSGDYALAIKYGSNIIRLGTAIFGNRSGAI